MFTTSLNNGDYIPVGSVRQLGSGTLNIPAGWLTCDGSAISRTLYKALFDVIGTSYGSGDGTTTFNLPTQSAIINSINDTVAVAGTGKTLGLTDGQHNFGVRNGSATIAFASGGFNKNLGDATGATDNATQNAGIGVTIDSMKSGLTGTLTKDSVPYIFIIKY